MQPFIILAVKIEKNNMEINVYIVLGILFTHWIADFVLQTDWQAKNKSKDNMALLSHTVFYTFAWILPSLLLVGQQTHWFLLITLASHTITDYFTSRLNSKLWANGKVHEFFVSVGFDQFLHYVQLLLTYQLLK